MTPGWMCEGRIEIHTGEEPQENLSISRALQLLSPSGLTAGTWGKLLVIDREKKSAANQHRYTSPIQMNVPNPGTPRQLLLTTCTANIQKRGSHVRAVEERERKKERGRCCLKLTSFAVLGCLQQNKGGKGTLFNILAAHPPISRRIPIPRIKLDLHPQL